MTITERRANRIEQWPVERLRPYERNAKIHSPAQIGQIAESIKRFGFNNPILVDSADGIIAGHGRFAGAQKLGLRSVPVIVLDHLSDAERRAYIIADNRIAENAAWDNDLLTAELAALNDEEFDLGLLGFTDRELEQMLAADDGGRADECPDVPDTAVTRTGDLWLLGRHRVLCGDATNAEDVARLMGGAKADMVFTDPPYGIAYQSNSRTMSPRFDVLTNDCGILDIAPIVMATLNDNAAAYIWTHQKVYPVWREQFAAIYRSTIIWHKPGGGMGDLTGDYCPDYEMALFCVRGDVAFRGSRNMAVWKIAKDNVNEYRHPTQKPVALGVQAVQDFSDREDIVLDLFGGSGSTLIACEKTSRQARLTEIDPKYCDVIVTRWQDYTSQAATLDGDGRTFAAISAERKP